MLVQQVSAGCLDLVRAHGASQKVLELCYPGMTNTPVCIPGPPVCIPASAHMGTPRMRRPRGTAADMTSAPRRRRPHIGGLAHGLAYITPLAGHRDRSALGQGRDAAGDSALLSDTVLLTLYVDRGPVIEPSFRV